MMDTTWLSNIKDQFKKAKNQFPSDSVLAQIKKIRKTKIELPEVGLSKNRFLDGHMLNYTATYTSRIEGVYDYSDILQQNLNYTTKVNIFNNLPFNLSLFGRYTNSNYFRNYIDFSIDLNGNDLASFAKKQSQASMDGKLNTHEKMLELYVNDKLSQASSLKHQLNLPKQDTCINLYIHYKEIIANKNIYLERIESGINSVLKAEEYIGKYEKARKQVDSIKNVADSLINVYENALDDIRQIEKYGKDQWNDKESLYRKYAAYLHGIKIDTAIVGEYRKTFWDGFNKLSLGRTMPISTQLSMQNISIKGISTEYRLGDIFTVLQAGWTDFGLRDFLFHSSRRKINNFVYTAGIGVGDRNRNYLLATFFGGKRNQDFNIGGQEKQNSLGLSLSGQLAFKHILINGEAAQSNYVDPTSSGNKSSFRFSDNTNKAYSISAYNVVPQWGLNANAYYKYYGINYYGFNAYHVNANNNQWGIQAGKKLFKNVLSIDGAIKKNDYKNPYVEQVYSGKNIVTTLNATFRKNRWVASLGYIPSFQYVSINDTIYENNYQVINCMAGYSYKIGEVPATTSLIFNRFFNGNTPSAYFYGNSTNFAFNQGFHFDKYTSTLNASVIKNKNYDYVIFDGCVQYQISQAVSLKGGFKINNLSKAAESESKLGGYGGTSFMIPKVGVFTLQMDCNYYPDMNYKLYNSSMGVMSFTTYFK